MVAPDDDSSKRGLNWFTLLGLSAAFWTAALSGTTDVKAEWIALAIGAHVIVFALLLIWKHIE